MRSSSPRGQSSQDSSTSTSKSGSQEDLCAAASSSDKQQHLNNAGPKAAGDVSRSADTLEKKSDFRAGEAYVRPTPIYTNGDVVDFGFHLKQCTFQLKIRSKDGTKEKTPTEIYLPTYHFPPENTKVEVSEGRWTLTVEALQTGTCQTLKWWHSHGEQKIEVKRSLNQSATSSSSDICSQSTCTLM